MAKVASIRTVPSRTIGSQDTAEQIRKKAYELYEKRGKKAGHAFDDWLEAERIIKQKKY